MKSILLLNGPNLNRLGLREPHIYGHETLADVEEMLQQWGKERNVQVSCFQSNHEGELVDKIHQAAADQMHGIIINPGAFTHYSYAIRDAIASVALPVIEVHISNVYKREEFRHHSVTAPVSLGQITGLGIQGYQLAAEALYSYVHKQEV